MFLSLILTNEGRVKKCIDLLYFHFASTSKTPGLLPSNRDVWTNIVSDLTSHEVFVAKLKELKYKAALAGEFQVISHDETFKSMFCIIGQVKMSQKPGEFHTLHTFRGFTGATVGVSPQRSVSKECFEEAVKSSFDKYLSSKVKFVFSDAPTRIFRAARTVFKSLIAVGEDPIHLPIRLEYCSGGKITLMSARVRQLHRKFQAAAPSFVRFWQPDDVTSRITPWPLDPHADTRSKEQWDSFCTCPFAEDGGYFIYVAELAKISMSYEACMLRKNSQGVTALTILKNGASRNHYEGLQNSSRLLALLGTKANRLGTGTARNEQLHRELKSWMRNIRMAHIDRVYNGLRIFMFAKLLTHSSASYFPTLIQCSQSRLLSIIAGNLRVQGFFPTQNITNLSIPLPTGTRNDLHVSHILTDAGTAATRAYKRKLETAMWNKRNTEPRPSVRSETDIFRRPRIDSRDRVFKRKKTPKK